jgi:hypothetical protein
LFDIEQDRSEVKNLINEPGMKGLISDLKQQLRDLILQYKDEDALKIIEKQ